MKQILLLAFTSSLAVSAETPSRAALLRKGEQERRTRITTLRNKMRKHQKALKSPSSRRLALLGGVVPLSIYERKIKEYGSLRGKYLPTLEMKPDSVGVFRDTRLQIGSAGRNTSYGWTGSRVTVRQVIDAENVLVDWGKTSLWVGRMSTENLVDGKKLRLPGIFRYAGTKQYQTVIGGTKTVYLIEKVGDE